MVSAAEQMAANLSWSSIGKAKDLQNRILYALLLLIIYRAGTYVPVPGVDAEIDVDLKRAHFLDFAPYILGALLTAAGVAKKNADYDNKESDVLDAIIEDEDPSS